jgi:tetratricopeptide (TPR) repeat protein
MHSVLYASTSPDTADARLAGEALARAERLAADHPATYHTRGLYYLFVKNDPARALEAFDAGLARWPQDVDLLGTAGATDRRPERTGLALARLRRAQELDPRSVPTAIRFSFRLSQEHRFADAREVADRGLELAPTNLVLLLSRVMADLGDGNADGARAVVARAAATPGMDPAALAANFAEAEGLHWLLDESQQRLVLDLPPSAFDNSRSTWALGRTRMHAHRGDTAVARAWADTAERELAREIRASPEEPRVRLMRAVALGFMGRHGEAIREGERGMALIKDLHSGLESHYLLRQMAQVHLMAGDRERALDRLEQLLGNKQHYSGGWLRVDPAYAALREEERFRRMTVRP